MFQLTSALALLCLAQAAPESDAVPELPLYGVPPAPMYSGFLNASAVEPGTFLHYWLALAESPDAWNMPLVLWLNGGPGSSSILGFLQEMGPVLINATGGLFRNPYAWTKQANLLILESPAGVGYSYCAQQTAGTGNCSNTDISTARAARAALQDFFSPSKFPEFAANPLYITGESYAGVYIPTLSREVLDHAPEINLRGVAVGDPCTSYPDQKQSMDMLWYAHKHGLVPDADYAFLRDNCSAAYPALRLARGRWRRAKGGGAWDDDVAAPHGPGAASRGAGGAGLRRLANEALRTSCDVAHRRFLATTSMGLSQSWDGSYINELDLFTDAAALDWTLPGTLNYFNAQYMMRADVVRALHLERSPAAKANGGGGWPGPPEGWSYTSNYNACNDAPGMPSMVEFYRYIAPRLARTIVFNGDTDPCVSYEGTRTAIARVGFAVLPGGAYRPWFYNKSAATLGTLEQKPSLFGPSLELRDAGAQFGGQVVSYEHGLAFATVHGSGHMVPQFRPQAAERLLAALLEGGDYALSPPLMTDEQLAAMTEPEFESSVDKWTAAAKGTV